MGANRGTVYEEFDRNVHVIDSFALPPQWRRIHSSTLDIKPICVPVVGAG